MNKYIDKVKDMTCEDVYAMASARMTVALMMHADMADYFAFLSMHGFKRLHEYQYVTETVERTKFHHDYIDKHNKLIVDTFDISDRVSVIPSDWIKYTQNDIDDSVTAKFVRHAFEIYRTFETETRDLYSAIYCHMLSVGNVVDADVFKAYIDDVEHEIKGIDRLMHEMQNAGYDAVYIVEIQKEMHDKYKKKLHDVK